LHLPHYSLSLLSFPMIPPPPTSTLFPYTTLFRSLALAESDAEWIETLHADAWIGRGYPLPSIRHAPGGPAARAPGRVLPSIRGLDRKSTRLNSSHGSISYAVFCLKKKTKTKIKTC